MNALSTKRVRHVFPGGQVAHLWAHRTQDDARSPTGNIYFRGDSIYSYGDHFEIARHVSHNGEAGILLTTRTYSMTTAGHIADVRRAIPAGVKVFRVPLCGRWMESPTVWMLDYVERFESALNDAKKAREKKLYHLNAAQLLHEKANQFAEFYGLEERIILPENFAEMKAEAEQKNAAREELRQRNYQIKNAARIAKAEENLVLWMNGGYAADLHVLPYTYFRLKSGGEIVQSTYGAEVPLDHAERAYRLMKRIHDAGKSYHRNGTTIRVGHYDIDSLEGETVRAGCHTIEWAEIERFAVLMGWTATEGGAL